MDKINFVKMSGSGNDFIIIDNRTRLLEKKDLPAFAQSVCERKLSVGADGLIIIENSHNADFGFLFFNADGSKAEMCGNGGRCVARYAFLNGIGGSTLTFETEAGLIRAKVIDERVSLEMTEPRDLKLDMSVIMEGVPYTMSYINTGVPHVVVFVENLETYNVADTGRAIRFHSEFEPAGTNVNFVDKKMRDQLFIRTYERGVEDETLACGTGSVASALIAYKKGFIIPPVSIVTRGEEVLSVDFADENGRFIDVFLEGAVTLVYEGVMWKEGWVRKGVCKIS
ncbi:MAG: diaminopimelate epimerase [Thermodesulfobacteriota bacterium]|nr:diaminopimelate epimerase [Thermodesulfobacteriota bacterium]